MQPQEKVRKMRPGGRPRRFGRSADGYYRPAVSTAPELILVTDEDGNLTDAYIAYIENDPEDTP